MTASEYFLVTVSGAIVVSVTVALVVAVHSSETAAIFGTVYVPCRVSVSSAGAVSVVVADVIMATITVGTNVVVTVSCAVSSAADLFK